MEQKGAVQCLLCQSGLEVKEGGPPTDVYQRDERGLLFSNSLPLRGNVTNYRQLKDRTGVTITLHSANYYCLFSLSVVFAFGCLTTN